MTAIPRVAFLTDTYHEVNGVALTSRQLEAFARERDYPMLCVYGGDTFRKEQRGSVTHLQLSRGPLALHLDKGLRQDPVLWRFFRDLTEAVEEFRPDVLHITSPGDVGEMGAAAAYKLKIPLVISWHTNFHEFGALRLQRLLAWTPEGFRHGVGKLSARYILGVMVRFYRLGCYLFAPNQELVAMLASRTGRPVALMKRGIDTALYSPTHRTVTDGVFRIGYVGRLTPEKDVRFLVEIQTALQKRGLANFRFLVVGDGSERDWLAAQLNPADLPGVLSGSELAEAYANMDVFAFPSRTDTFGNVVLEALASGTPCVVTDSGGPKFIIEEGVSGFSCAEPAVFIQRIVDLMTDNALLARMRSAAREKACRESWETVFDQVYVGYRAAIECAPDG